MKTIKHLNVILPILVLSTFLIKVSVVQAQEIDLEYGLILNMPMNGNALDVSGQNTPTLVEGATLTSDRYGNPNSAYLFDGLDDQIRVNNNQAIIITKEYTISMWARIDGPSNALFDSNSLFEQRAIDPGGRPVVIHFNADYGNISRHVVRSSVDIQFYYADTEFPGYGAWHHFVAMIDEARMIYIFIDGELRTTTLLENDGSFYQDVEYVSIGAHHPQHYQGGAFNGAIDEIYIYNRSLNFCEIEALYSGQLLEER